ncbi:hypothetical protein HDE_06852 [Halotydeus destructor]|nr:hypothetical protein HDE_06852 [Halotydeus destructor]
MKSGILSVTLIVFACLQVCPSQPVGVNWIKSPLTGAQYALHEAKSGFVEALQFCNRHGGHLPTGVDEEERKWLFDNVSMGQIYWLGALNVPNTTYYPAWLDGSNLDWEYVLTDVLRTKGYGSECEGLCSAHDGIFRFCKCKGCADVFTVCTS